MKIAINARFLLPRLEGLGHYTHEIVDHLARAHPTDELHLIIDRNYHSPLLNHPNITTHILYPSARHPLLWYYWFEYQLSGLLKKIDPDVFFSPDGYLSLSSKIRTVLTIHDLAYLHFPKGTKFSHRKYLQYFIPRFIERADEIICVSEFTASDVISHFPLAKQKIHVVHNGVSESFRESDAEKIRQTRSLVTGGRPYFLYIGSIHPRKNISRLIEAFNRYKSSSGDEILLVIGGRMAWDTKAVQEAISSSFFTSDICLIEELDHIIHDLIASAEAMCYVSLFEGFGLPVLEAMASGVPVITSAKSAMSEVCGPAAIYVDPRNCDQIANAMSLIRNNNVKRQKLIKGGLCRSKNFTWLHASESIYQILDTV